MGVGGQRHAPADLPPEMTRYPLYRTLGGPQGRSGRVRKISPPPGFDPRIAQPVASRYTDWTILAHSYPTVPELNYLHGAGPSSEANRYSAGQEIPCIFMKPGVS
jgi:hypothetical protein